MLSQLSTPIQAERLGQNRMLLGVVPGTGFVETEFGWRQRTQDFGRTVLVRTVAAVDSLLALDTRKLAAVGDDDHNRPVGIHQMLRKLNKIKKMSYILFSWK